MEKLLTAEQIADYIQVSPRTIRNWVHEGYIPHIKFRRNTRFQKNVIKKWISKKERKGRATYRVTI